jgi:EmrB/QacA subfamily drug resistance transporter
MISQVDRLAAADAAPVFSVPTALAGLALSMLLSSVSTSIANVSLPTLVQAFGASFQQVQWVVLAYLLAITTLIISAGRLGDIVGRKRLLIAGLGLFTVASTASSVAPTLLFLIAARAVQGVGAAVMMALTMAFVADTASKEKIGSAMGLLGATSAVGTALGPSVGGLLIASFGWPSIFLINLPLGLLTMVLAWRGLPTDRAVKVTTRFDVIGTLVLVATLGTYALAMTTGRGEFGAVNLALVSMAIVGAGVFAFSQSRVGSPLIQMSMLHDAKLRSNLGSALLVSTVMMATLVVGPFYLSQALALDPATVGLVMSVGPLVAALAGLPAGRMVDRFGARPMIVTGLSGVAASCFILAMMPQTFGILGYVLPLAGITACYALFQAANNTAVMMDVALDRRGVMSAMLNLSRNLGLVTGAAVMGAVFAQATAAPEIMAAASQAVATGMRVTFLLAAALIAGALVLALRGGRGAG